MSKTMIKNQMAILVESKALRIEDRESDLLKEHLRWKTLLSNQKKRKITLRKEKTKNRYLKNVSKKYWF